MTDLHTHTTASDGTLSRAHLLEFAALCGAERIAITDHDTMKHSYPAPDDPVEVVPGCELSASNPLNGKKVHVLCYMPHDQAQLEPYFDLMHQRRKQRGEGYYQTLRKQYPVITRERLERYSADCGVYMKQHFMDVLMDYGYTSDVCGELYRKLFSKDAPVMGEPEYPSVYEALEAIKAARGVAVIAHPSVYDSMELVRKLVKEKLPDGIEVDHYRNAATDKAELTELCTANGLLMTGGSDYHARTNNQPVMIGTGKTAPEQYARLLQCAQQK